MENIHEANKHLTYEERTFIEIGLNQGRNYTEIAKDINKDRRTIAREIEKHKFKRKPGSFNGKKNFCERRFECNKFDCNETDKCYREEVCEYLLKPPYVCNGCENKNRCRKIKKYYYAKYANDKYKETLSSKRMGINLSLEEAYDIDTLIKPLIQEKHQTIAHVYANHPDEITFSRTTMYKYINLGVFSLKNIDWISSGTHSPIKQNVKVCDCEGNNIEEINNILYGPNYNLAYFKHFIVKTPTEYIFGKVKRGCPDLSEEENNNRHTKDFYFAFSKWTKEKEEIFDNYF